MPTTSRDDAYLEPYRRSLERHGPLFEVALWANPDSQRKRFEVFTQLAYLHGKRILDAGCGRGDFAAFLIERGVAFERYIGIDALPRVIEFASGRDLPNCEFHCGDLVNDADLFAIGRPQVICLSGTLNTMPCDLALRVLESAWAGAEQTLLFNFLSSRCGRGAARQTGPARRMDPLRFLDWALHQTPLVVFRQDYFPQGHDATIVMRKEKQAK